MVNNNSSLELNCRGEDGEKWQYYGYILKVKSIELDIKLDVGCEMKRNLKDKIFDPKTEQMELLLVDWEEYGRNELWEVSGLPQILVHSTSAPQMDKLKY